MTTEYIYDGLPNTVCLADKFTGKERDTESGLDYFGARYYGSSMGRFMSPDWSAKQDPVPYANLENPQSLNLYAYVNNNPLSRFDPDGHNGFTDWWKNLGQRIANGWNGYGWHTNQQVDDIVSNTRRSLNQHGQSTLAERLSYKQTYQLGTGKGTEKDGVTTFIVEGGVVTFTTANAISSQASTGRTEAANLNEQLAMEQAQANPTAGETINLKGGMEDPRWPEGDGWVKMRQNVNGTEIHYVRNTNTGEVADFKFN